MCSGMMGTRLNREIDDKKPGSAEPSGYPTPYGAIRGPGWLLSSFIFDTLAVPDVTGQPKPWLAKSWQVSRDGKTWTFQHKAS
jgi:ABC-type transport system substrate-binding protein